MALASGCSRTGVVIAVAAGVVGTDVAAAGVTTGGVGDAGGLVAAIAAGRGAADGGETTGAPLAGSEGADAAAAAAAGCASTGSSTGPPSGAVDATGVGAGAGSAERLPGVWLVIGGGETRADTGRSRSIGRGAGVLQASSRAVNSSTLIKRGNRQGGIG